MKMNQFYLVLGTVALGWLAAAPAEAADENWVGKPAPRIELNLLEGGKFNLADHRGKHVVILDFWATWCGPCRQAMPILIETAQEYQDKGVRYFAVDLQEDAETVRGFLEKAGFKIEVPLDVQGQAAEKYGVQSIPMMLIVDKQGKVRWQHLGTAPDLKAKVRLALDGLVSPPRSEAK